MDQPAFGIRDRDLIMTELVGNMMDEGRIGLADRRAFDPIDFGDAANALHSLISQAETLLRTCRTLVTQVRDPSTGSDGNWAQRISELQDQQDAVADWAERAAGARADKSDGRTYRRYDHMDVDVDLLQIFKSCLPDLGIAPLVVLTTLLANQGRIVSNAAIRKALGTESLTIVKVYVTRLRHLFRSHGVDVEISVLKGGYGLPRDCAVQVLSGLGFDDTQIKTILSSSLIERART
ncbi:MAG: hypothetical protein RIS17_1713 [Pseudomonadota bacterium]|jgi:hypothetical protein